MKTKSKLPSRKPGAKGRRQVASSRHLNFHKISAKLFKRTDLESSSCLRFEETDNAVERVKQFLKNNVEIYNDDDNDADDDIQLKETNSEKQYLSNALIDDSKKKSRHKGKKIPNLTPEQDETIRKMYKDRKMMVTALPVIELREAGNEASLSIDDEARYPVFFPDIVQVLTHVQNNRYSTRWLHVKKASKLVNTILLIVEGVGLAEYESEINACPSLQSYSVAVEFVSPLTYGDNIQSDLASRLNIQPSSENSESDCENETFSLQVDDLNIPLTSMFDIKTNDNGNCSNNASKKKSSRKRPYDSLESGEDLSCEQVLPISLCEQDAFSRLDLVMTPNEMARERYPLPFIAKYHSFVKTKEEYTEVTAKSPMFGLDCEMCQTQFGSELTRISVVNELHEIVYERLVKPYNRITDYLTKYSGITAAMMRDVQTRLPDVQKELRELLPSDAILVGQSLNFDLVALKMMHPYIIDTSVIFNLSGLPHHKTKLATLCAEFISESIQRTSKTKLGHDSIEDSVAALKLTQAKLRHSLMWGNAMLGYKRTEAESQKAHLILLENEKNSSPVKYRLAYNALVDDYEIFDPALSDPQQRNSLKANKITYISQSEEIQHYEDLNFKVIKKKKKKGSYKTHECDYNEAAIISSPALLQSYERSIPESTLERVTFHEVEKNSKAIKKILELDSEENKRVIIAHIQSSYLSRVEKLSAKLLSECKGNSLICLCLAGSKGNDESRGAFLASIPAIKKLAPMKQVINGYLQSIGLDPNT